MRACFGSLKRPDRPCPIHTIGLPTLSRTIHGRDAELADLRGALLGKGEAAIVPGAVVQGQGGLGKSTLARFYAERFKSEYHGILWVAAENGPAQGVTAAGPALGVAVAGLPAGEAAKAVLAAMAATGQPWLVVFDNVAEPKALAGLVPQGGQVHLIVTTREGFGWDGYGVIRAGMLPFDTEGGAAVLVLMEAAGRKDGAAEARLLAADLGGLPLALVVAGALIRESGEGFEVYRGRLAQIIRQVPPGDYPTSVIGAVKLSYDRLRADARMVLDLFAWFAAEGLEARLLTDVPGGEWVDLYREEIGAELMALASDAGRVEAALLELQRAALLDREAAGSYALHRLSAMAVRALQAEPEQVARAAAAVLGAVYPRGTNGPLNSSSWPRCGRLTVHVAALVDCGAAPATAAMESLLNQASIYLSQMAEPVQSLRFAREALRLKVARLPECDPEVALGHANLGQALRQSGDLARAEAHISRAMRLDEVHRPGTVGLARTYAMYGQVLARMPKREDEGLRRAQQALALLRSLFGRWHVDVAQAVNDLGWHRDRKRQGAAALRLSLASLTIWRRVLPSGDARLGLGLSNCGAGFLKQGRADKAERFLQDALDLREAVHDRADHPHRRDAANWLIICLLVRAERGENRGARQAEAKVLCGRYGFEFAEQQAEAVAFARQHGLV